MIESAPLLTDAGIQLATSAGGSGIGIAMLWVYMRGEFALLRKTDDTHEVRLNNLEAKDDG